MAHFFGRFFKKTARKGNPSPAYFEALESRQLLSATYANADVAGTWAVIGSSVSGSVVINSSGAVDAVAVGTAITNGGVAVTDSYLAFDLNNDGTVAFDANDGSADVFALDGALNSNKSIITLGTASSQSLMVKTGSDYSTSDIAGKWSFATESLQGTAEFTVNGSTITIKSLTVYQLTTTEGVTTRTKLDVKAADSTATFDADTGEVVLTLKKGTTTVKTLTGVMSESKDTIGFSTVGSTNGETDVGIATKTGAATYAKTDLATGTSGYDWSVTGDSALGALNIKLTNGKYVLSLATGETSATIFGETATAVSGSLAITGTGVVTGKITYTVGGTAKTVEVTGQMNASKNIISLYSTKKEGTLVLTTSVDHASVNANANKTVVADVIQKAETKTLTFDEILSAAGITDIDDINDVTSVQIKVVSGTLTIGGDPVVADDGFVTLTRASGDTLTWAAASNAKYTKISAFSVRLDADASAATVAYNRVSNVVSIKASASSVAEDPAKSITITLTRSYVPEGDAGLTVSFTSDTGTATSDDYTISAATSVTFAAGSKTATITITPKTVTNITLDRTVIVTLTTADNKAYDLAATKSATVTIKGNKISTDTPVTVKASVNKITEGATDGVKGSYVDFTISRAKATTSALELSYSGIDLESDRYTVLLVNEDGTTAAFSDDVFTIAANKTSVKIRLQLVADSVAFAAQDVTLAVDIANNVDKTSYYVDGKKNIAKVSLVDNEPTVTVKAVDADEKGTAGNFTLTRSGGDTNAALTVTFTVTGTATLTNDYAITATGGTVDSYVSGTKTYTVTFAAKSKAVKLTLTPVGDLVTEGDETAILTLTGTNIVKGDAATLTIKDYVPALTVKTAASSVNEGSSTSFTIESDAEVDSDLTVTFKLNEVDAEKLGTYLTDFTVTGATYDAGTKLFTTKILAGFKSVKITIDALGDKLRTEGKELINITLQDGSNYTKKVAAKTITINDDASNNAPKVNESSITISGKDFVIGDTVGKTVTAASLISGADVTDEDSTFTLKITKIESGVSLYVGGELVVLTGADANNVLASNAVITVVIASTGKASTSATLFSFVVRDSENGESGKVAVKGAIEANVAPTVTQASTPTLTNNAGTYTLVLSDPEADPIVNLSTYLTSPDANAGDTVTVKVTAVLAGSLKINSEDWNATTNATISATDTVEWTATAQDIAAGDLNILTITATDGTATSTALTFKVTVPDAAPSQGTSDIALDAVDPAAVSTLTFADLLDATGATDLNGDNTIVFNISGLSESGISFSKISATNVTTAITGDTVTIAAGEKITWTNKTAAGSTDLFSIKAAGASTAAVVVSITVNDVAPTLSQKANPDVSISGAGTFTLDDSNFATYLTSADANGSTVTYTITAIDSGTLTIGGVAWDAGTNATFTLASLASSSVVWTKAGGATVADGVSAFTLTATSTTHTTDAITFKVDLIA